VAYPPMSVLKARCSCLCQDVVVKQFTFAVSSPDELLVIFLKFVNYHASEPNIVVWYPVLRFIAFNIPTHKEGLID